ncbi:o-succinylbenzoate synthase [Salimicrobium halophilum]|uniref:o-succinylbenzoate synthase n=1 Tax=Salimicrobium halophilum TaxID=86666 RepID=A0A1G8VBI8_9BACI|nr:o-succinylbenzoate synthase [Salimicrobium halophilum]SDJ63482.1 O-succinylbenzoate synthase [Salimicrobium halophilum]
MNLSEANLYHIDVPMKQPFTTAHGKLESREVIIVELTDESGRKGYGEISAFSSPFYTGETVKTAWHISQTYLLPYINRRNSLSPLFDTIQGHPMAKAGIEQAWYDLLAKQNNVSLSEFIGGDRQKVAAGGVISLSGDPSEELDKVKDAGFQRAKVKVEKGREREQLALLRENDKDFPLMIDGNGAYDSIDSFLNLDDLNLLMIEQPFRPGDFYLHRMLQEKMQTPICLDESIRSYADAEQAYALAAAQIFNIKISRVGGWSEALSIHELAMENDIPLWCGGMVETGIGKAHSLALASLPGFTLPGDLSGSDRYFEQDILKTPIRMDHGYIDVPQGIGIGVEPDMEVISRMELDRYTFTY